MLEFQRVCISYTSPIFIWCLNETFESELWTWCPLTHKYFSVCLPQIEYSYITSIHRRPNQEVHADTTQPSKPQTSFIFHQPPPCFSLLVRNPSKDIHYSRWTHVFDSSNWEYFLSHFCFSYLWQFCRAQALHSLGWFWAKDDVSFVHWVMSMAARFPFYQGAPPPTD